MPEQDPLVWKKKDALIVAQHAQKVAAQLAIHTDKDNTLTGTLKLAAVVNETADVLAQEAYAIADRLVNKVEKHILPLPNQEQLKVLEQIGAECAIKVDDKLKEEVLTWAKDTHGVRQYPASQASVKSFIERS